MGIFDKEIAEDHPLYQGGTLVKGSSKKPKTSKEKDGKTTNTSEIKKESR